ncbi:restriction endonuclease subunit S [Brachyspira alvinipulli]|uniref:restriction endonuclease subunit S n=1 Tax=Brachyspira alvinipulli TaxID=84379 RepID=UPI00300647E1
MTASELKKSILQMAVEGKLTEQSKENEPVEELLKRIKEEKESLIKEGKIKKEKTISEIYKKDGSYYERVSDGKNILKDACIDEELPFEIPDTWTWCRIDDIFIIEMGQSPKGDTVYTEDKGIEFHQGKVFFGDKYILKSNQTTSSPTKIAPQNSLLLCVRAPVGKVNITKREICIGRGLCCIQTLSGMSVDFIYYLFETYEDIFIKKATGTTFVAITSEVIKKQLVPLPPIEEQKRIVEKINFLMPLINEYDELEKSITKLNKEFPDNIKKSILQYAIEGKLTEQNKSDEPVEKFLKRIKKEREKLIKEGKIKKDKTTSEIYKKDGSYYERVFEGDNIVKDVCIDDELPFDIPDSWTWVRLTNIFSIRGGKRIPKGYGVSKNPTKHIYIRVSDMKNNTIIQDDLHYISNEVYELIKNYTISKDDLYLTIAGTIGKVGIVPDFFDKMNLTENAVKLTNILIDKYYLLLIVSSSFVQTQFIDKTNKVAQPKLAIERILTTIIPLPPIEEQKRIVDKINRLNEVINTIKI